MIRFGRMLAWICAVGACLLGSLPAANANEATEAIEIAYVEGRFDDVDFASASLPPKTLRYLRALRDFAWRPSHQRAIDVQALDSSLQVEAWLSDSTRIDSPFTEDEPDPAPTATILLQDRRVRESASETPQKRSASLLHSWRVNAPRLGRAIDMSLIKYDAIYGPQPTIESVEQAKAHAHAARNKARWVALIALAALILTVLLISRRLLKPGDECASAAL